MNERHRRTTEQEDEKPTLGRSGRRRRQSPPLRADRPDGSRKQEALAGSNYLSKGHSQEWRELSGSQAAEAQKT